MSQGTPKAKGYVHGYSREEQDRLYEQARFLERLIYGQVDFSSSRRVIEVGCGVGAQTEILLERFPSLKIDGIDASSAQIARAREHLREPVARGQVELHVGDAARLPFGENSFDGAFVCWLLEHVADPKAILADIRRVLRPGGMIYCTEVLNATFYLHPYSPATLQYWFAFNDHQWTLGGDPFIGAKLGNYLMATGYQNIETRVLTTHCDNRTPKLRAQMIDYWTRLLLSGTPGLLEAKRVTQDLVDAMTAELKKLKHDPDSVFFYSAIQAKGQVF